MRLSMHPGWALLILAGASLTLSCGDDGVGPWDDRPVVGLAVEPAGLTLSGVAATGQLDAQGLSEKEKWISNPRVTWSSLNPAVATVDPTTGEVTAVASGQATVRAVGNGAEGYALVTVSVPGLGLPTSWTLDQGPNPNLHGVWAGSSNDVLVVGSGGTILHYDGADWNGYPGTHGDFQGISGSSADNLFAATPGGISRFDGTAWSPPVALPQAGLLKDIFAPTATTAFAVGYQNTVARYSGGVWNLQALGADPATAWYGVGGSSPDDVYAVGRWQASPGGLVWHFDGTSWQEAFAGASGILRDIWSSSPSDVFAVGDDNYDQGFPGVLHFDGTAWSWMDAGQRRHLEGVWGSGSQDVFAVGEEGAVVHYDGTGWTEMESGTTNFLLAVGGSGPNDVYAAGTGGLVLRYDGNAWTPLREGGPGSHLYAVWGLPGDDVFAGGASVMRFNGGTGWVGTGEVGVGSFQALWGASSEEVYGARTSGIWRFDGAQWNQLQVAGSFRGIWGSSPADIFAVGTGGAVLHSGGSNWVAMGSGTGADLLGVWGTSAQDVFAVGDGVILHFDGENWSGMQGGPEARLNAVWGTASDNVYVVGSGGTILRYDGVGWNAMNSGTEAELMGIWGTSSGDIYATGPGLLLHFDGSAWTPLTLPFHGDIRLWEVWTSSVGPVVAVGEFGTILRGIR
ncbi:MAG: Ig-like domain-containing protein [Longimicrobiales bacterium]